MTPKFMTVLALAGLTAATLSTAAMAERGPAMGGEGGPFSLQMFDTIDADKDSKITQAELDAFRKAQATAADTDGDGLMSAEELAAMHLATLTERARDMAARMVERHDTDADGKLSAAEMAARPMPEKLFERIDTDSDGAISKAEAEAAAAQMEKRHGKRKRGHN